MDGKSKDEDNSWFSSISRVIPESWKAALAGTSTRSAKTEANSVDKNKGTSTTTDEPIAGKFNNIRKASKDAMNSVMNAASNAFEEIENETENATKLVTEKVVSKMVSAAGENIPNLHETLSAFSGIKTRVMSKYTNELIHPEINDDAEVRTHKGLCDREKEFLKKRKEHIKENFAKYVGVDVKEIDVDDIPVIAFAGSGGGFRAMIANTAYLRAIQDSGLYDCGIYLAGVSGCCLSIAQQYSSLHATKDNPVQDLLEHFKTRLNTHLASPTGVLKDISVTKSPDTAVELTFGGLVEKRESGLITQAIDTFGSLLSVKLLLAEDPESQRQDFKLSQQRRYLEKGEKMLPIYTSVILKEKFEKEELEREIKKESKSGKEGTTLSYDWYEFTPYEIGSDEHSEWIPTWAFGRGFKDGKNIKRIPEQNIGQLLGMVGSAPCAPMEAYISKFEHVTGNGWLKEGWDAVYSGFSELAGSKTMTEFKEKSLFPPSENHNHSFSNSVNLKLQFLDSGASNDLPLYPLTYQQRKVDVIIAFDSSGSTADHKYFKEQQQKFASNRGIKIEERDVNNKYCEIYNYLPDSESSAIHPCTFCYVPYLGNDKVKKDFLPCKKLGLTKFEYSKEEIDLMVNLAKQNWLEAGEEKVRNIIIEAWKKKKEARGKK